MRQDAIRRSREAQRRARPAPPGYSGTAYARQAQAQPQPAQKQPAQAPPAPEPAAQELPAQHPVPEKAPSFFEALFADGERNLVLGLLLLFMEEKERDPALTFALLYLLL